jgi:hypothetical protein
MSEFRGSRVGDVKETMQQECRFRDMRNCDLSQPLNQAQIWTVDLTPCRSFGDRELEMSKFINIRNPDITICEIAI